MHPHRSPRSTRSLSPPTSKGRPAVLGVRRSFSPPSKQRVSNAQTLDSILSDPATRAMFTQYCQAFHASENIAFFLAVERYRNVKNEAARCEHAQEIYRRFIVVCSPPVSICSFPRKFTISMFFCRLTLPMNWACCGHKIATNSGTPANHPIPSPFPPYR